MPGYSVLAIPAYWAIVFSTHYMGQRILFSKKTPLYDNVMPRGNQEAIEKGLGKAELREWQRCRAAQANGWESFPLFIAAVVAAQNAGVKVDGFAAGILALRALYNVLYIKTESKRLSFLRTAVWTFSTLWELVVLVQVGLAGV